MTGKAWTVLQILKETTLFFEKKGIASPRLDAEILLAYSLNTDRVGLYIKFDRPLNENEISSFRQLVLRRAKREPVQYITGRTEFWSRDFKVGKGVLIPRRETEHLIEEALKVFLGRKEESLFFLDIGTGCGIIAITLAHEFKNSKIWAVEPSYKAVEFAFENAKGHGVDKNMIFLNGRGFESLKDGYKKFDAVFSNPPYIETEAIAELEEQVREYEPYGALDGGEDGLRVISAIIRDSHRYIKNGGWLFLEVGKGQSERVSKMMSEEGNFSSIGVAKDMAGIDRVVSGRIV